jgi:hypothetical protein
LQEGSRSVERTFRIARSIAVAIARWIAVALALTVAVARTGGAATAPMAPVEAGEEPLTSWSSPVGALSYTPGRGFRVGDTGLTLGGYSNLTLLRDEGKPARLSLEDLSLFVIYEPIQRLRFFSELEYADVFDVDDQGHVESREESASVERMYLDVEVSDAVNLRGGIFLTPVGRWNMIHAAPLVWTTSRPLTTERPFDPNVTGVVLSGSLFPSSGILTYDVFDQFAGPIEGNPDFDPADHSAGARLAVRRGSRLVGGNELRGRASRRRLAALGRARCAVEPSAARDHGRGDLRRRDGWSTGMGFLRPAGYWR